MSRYGKNHRFQIKTGIFYSTSTIYLLQINVEINTIYNKHTSIERETSHISVDVYEYIHVFTYIILMIPHHQP